MAYNLTSMREILIQKLHEYIRLNNPDILIPLQGEGEVSDYLSKKLTTIEYLLEQLTTEEKPAYIIEELCLDALTASLRPSKYNFIKAILAEEFEDIHQQLERSGTLKYEVINLIEVCKPVFDELGFTEENEEDPQLRNALIGSIQMYFQNSQ